MSADTEPRLTEKQGRALKYIYQFRQREGMIPTLREVQEGLGYAAIGSIQDIVAKLRRMDLIEPAGDKQRARSLRITPKGMSIINTKWAGEERRPPVDNTLVVPCLGMVPAGNPLEAVEESTGNILVGANNFKVRRPKVDCLFAVQAVGESMIMAGIMDGDWLIVEGCKEAPARSIVVARIGDQATVKRLMLDDMGWYLQPENPDYKVIRASDSNFEVVGRVLSVQRYLH